MNQRQYTMACLILFVIVDWVFAFIPLGSILLLYFVITKNQWFKVFLQEGYGE
jgi:hypothetical protein